jgi:mRNA interferase RelE/StbE
MDKKRKENNIYGGIVSTPRYRIELSPFVKKYMNDFSKEVSKRILDTIEKKLTTHPYEFGKPLKYKLKNHRSLRIGSYRVIYIIEEERIVVLIVEIDHRKDVYER